MRSPRGLLPVVALLVASSLRVTELPAQPSPSRDETVARIDSLFQRWTGTETPGCAVGASRGGRIVLERGYGMANLETATPIGASTIFHAASLAKQLTAMAVLLLERDGKLSLDDDVRRFLPALPAHATPVTIRHLLTHTSGLRDYVETLIFARGRFEEDRITRADMLDVVSRQRSLDFTPGSQFVYTNTGYALLATIVERASGRSLGELAAERIFAPLGMSRTRFQEEFTTLVPGRAAGYAARGSGWRSSMPNYDVAGPTNLLTTVGDLLRWARNFDSARVGDRSILARMTTSAVLATGDSTGYGFGVGLTRDRGARVEEHEGGDPGFSAYLGRYLDHAFAVAVLCNTRAANAVALGRGVAGIYLGDRLRAEPSVTLVAAERVDTTSVAAWAGAYFQPDRVEVVELSWRDGALYTARRGGRRLAPLGGNRFQVEGFPVVHTFAAGERPGYVASSLLPGRTPVRFDRRTSWSPTADELAAFAGNYESDELGSRWRVTVKDSTLLLRTGTADGLLARPVFADTFVSGQLVIEFSRDSQGVTGFRITHPRARRILFDRR